MDGLILLLLLVPAILLLLQATILSRSAEHRRLLETLYDKMNDLNKEVSFLSKQLKGKEHAVAVSPLFKKHTAEPVIPEPKEVIKETPVVPDPKPVAGKEPLFTPAPGIVTDPPIAATIKEEHQFPSSNKTIPEKNDTDYEKFIGENIASKIGITVLVLGISFFIKYAIDKDWVHESGRVIIGLISGCVLLGIAHRYRNVYRSFSSVLMGGGLTVFYFSIAFAFHQYHLIGQTAAFIFMVMVTAFAVFLSLFYDRLELAILATIGGFITPFLVSTGQDNYIALFTYLCILNGGLTALSWFKKWPAINTISLFFTTLIFGGWLTERLMRENNSGFPARHALGFAVIFYLLFVAMNIINTIRVKGRFAAFDFIILLSVNFLFYTAGTSVLGHYHNSNLNGIFTLSLGIFNLMLTAVFYGKKHADKNFVALLTGLAITFISLTAPVWLRGNHITLFWSAESVILFWLWQRTKYPLLKYASAIVLVLMLGNLVINWVSIYFLHDELIPVLINKGFITGAAAAVSLFIYAKLIKREAGELFTTGISMAAYKKGLAIATLAVLFFTGLLETYYQFITRFKELEVHTQFTELYTFAFVSVLLVVFRKNRLFQLLKIGAPFFCLTIFLFNNHVTQNVSEALLAGKASGAWFIPHWIAALLLLWMLADFSRYIYKSRIEGRTAFTWIVSGALIMVLSIEMYNLMLWSGQVGLSDRAWWENLYYKAGLSILWSVSSFVLMWLGLKYDFRTWRIISLSLFTITLGKLFLYDIRNIPPGGKIAAFILLGCLLLAVSFMYQRLKRIIMNNAGDDKPVSDDRI